VVWWDGTGDRQTPSLKAKIAKKGERRRYADGQTFYIP
jgi:hypothetical protein